MLKTKQSRLWFRLSAVFLLALGVLVLRSPDRVVNADQASDIEACYNEFGGRVTACESAQNSCRAQCYPTDGACLASCDSTAADCYGIAITGSALQDGFSDCLMENVFFTPEMCPSAPSAKAVCDAAFDSCNAAVENIEDQQAAMSLAADCWDAWDQCVDASGYWDCQ